MNIKNSTDENNNMESQFDYINENESFVTVLKRKIL